MQACATCRFLSHGNLRGNRCQNAIGAQYARVIRAPHAVVCDLWVLGPKSNQAEAVNPRPDGACERSQPQTLASKE